MIPWTLSSVGQLFHLLVLLELIWSLVDKTTQNDAAFTANSTVLLMCFLLKDLKNEWNFNNWEVLTPRGWSAMSHWRRKGWTQTLLIWSDQPAKVRMEETNYCAMTTRLQENLDPHIFLNATDGCLTFLRLFVSDTCRCNWTWSKMLFLSVLF